VPDLEGAVQAQLERFHPGTAPSFDTVLSRRRRRDVRRRALGAAAAVAIGATALGAGPALLGRATGESPVARVPAVGATAPDLLPSGLAGSWQVSGAGEEPGAVLLVSSQEVSLSRRCGVVSGRWGAGPDGLFVGQVESVPGACLQGGGAPGSWLGEVTRYRADGERWVLLDAQDRPVVTLSPTGPAASTAPSRSVAWDALDAVPALPGPGLRPAAPEQLPGRWVPVGEPRATQAFLRFGDDRSWTASVSCTSTGGLWSAGELGRIEAVAPYAVALAGCLQPALPVADWLVQADRLALDGDVLVLLDADGSALGRLQRAAQEQRAEAAARSSAPRLPRLGPLVGPDKG